MRHLGAYENPSSYAKSTHGAQLATGAQQKAHVVQKTTSTNRKAAPGVQKAALKLF
jgi:hypothetical protein